MHRPPLRRLAAATLVVALAASADGPAAQRPSSWTEVTLPGVLGASVAQRGKMVWIQHAGELVVFSAATRRWARHPLPMGAAVRGTNDVVLAQDGTNFTAISSARGTFRTLTAGPGATLVNPPSQGNDGVFLVRDGSTLHAFSGFHGTWQSRAIPAGAAISVERDVAIVSAGNQLLGFSALHGAWRTATTAAPMTTLVTDGNVGLATDGTTAWAFSALQDRWASSPLPANSGTPKVGKNVVVWEAPGLVLGYSAHRAAFALEPTGVIASANVEDHLAIATAPAPLNQYWLFSGPHASWTPLATAAPAQVAASSALVGLTEPGRVHAFSAFHPTIATRNATVSRSDVNTAVLATEDAGGALWIYSGLTGDWYPLPSRAAQRLPVLARQGALLEDGAGTAWAFDARSGTFHARSVTTPVALRVDSGSSLLALEHGNTLDCFDPRTRVWSRTTLPNGPPVVDIWRTSLIAGTASHLAGFSALHGDLEVLDLGARRRAVVRRRRVGHDALEGSFSAGSTPIFATKYSFCSIFE